jgi:hypothetical protein
MKVLLALAGVQQRSLLLLDVRAGDPVETLTRTWASANSARCRATRKVRTAGSPRAVFITWSFERAC